MQSAIEREVGRRKKSNNPIWTVLKGGGGKSLPMIG